MFDLIYKSHVDGPDLLIEGIGEKRLDIYVVQRGIHVILMG